MNFVVFFVIGDWAGIRNIDFVQFLILSICTRIKVLIFWIRGFGLAFLDEYYSVDCI